MSSLSVEVHPKLCVLPEVCLWETFCLLWVSRVILCLLVQATMIPPLPTPGMWQAGFSAFQGLGCRDPKFLARLIRPCALR